MKLRATPLSLFLACATVSPAVAQEPQPPQADQEPTKQSMELEAFLDLAAENAAVLEEHAAKIEKAEWQKYRAKWAWGPKVRSETSIAPVPANADPDSFGSNVDEIAGLDIGPFVGENLSIVVPVYTFGRISIARTLADLGIDTAELKRKKAALEVEYQVKRAYYSIQLSNSFAELLDEGSEIIKEKLAEMEEAREFGEADFETEDLRKLQVYDAEVDSRRLDNEKLGDVAVAGLRYFTSYKGDVEVGTLPEEGEPPPLRDLRAHVRQARRTRPDLALLQHAVEAREHQLALARRNFYPNIFVAGKLGLGWSTEDLKLRKVCRVPEAGAECIDTDDLFARNESNRLNRFSVGVALGIRWDFDFWQRRGKLGEVAAQNDEVLAQRRRARGAIELEIRKLWADAETARQKVEVTGRRLTAARRWRDQFGLTMQTGGGDIKDAVEPLKAYYQARALHLEARYDYLVARGALAQAVGLSDLSEMLPPQKGEQPADE